MRNGHLYKMRALFKAGTSLDEICDMFRNEYEADEIKSFLEPKKKRGRPKKVDTPSELTPEA